jgi:large subunit ribosomal protein L25
VQIPVEADATNIPQGIEVSVEGLELGQAVHASDLTLPPGVTLQVEPDTLVLHVIAQQVAEEPEAGEEGAEETPEALEARAETPAGDGQRSEGEAG